MRKTTRTATGCGALLGLVVMTSAAGQLTFTEVALEAGVRADVFGRGSAFTDLDGDGLDDIIATTASLRSPVYKQLPDRTFVDVGVAWGILTVEANMGVLATDFDNDGDIDIYFVSGGFEGGTDHNRLYRNDLDTAGIFVDVTAESGDAAILRETFSGTTFDYDRDGDLDIFLSPTRQNCTLLRNDGDLQFTDVTCQAGFVEVCNFRHCTIGDFDNDGWLDVGVGAQNGLNVLYRNRGDCTFENVAPAAGVEFPSVNFGFVFEDFDNDGWMDVFLPLYQLDPKLPPSRILRNMGDGTFVDKTVGSGLTTQSDMGHNTSDLDADGFPDIYIGTGSPLTTYDDELFLVTPDGAGGFNATNVTASSGILALGPTRLHGICFADYDEDGDVDVFTCNGGPANNANTLEPTALFRNNGTPHAWTKTSLTGVLSNRPAVGTRSAATTNTGRQVWRMHRVGNGFSNTDSSLQHYGIGTDTNIASIDFLWPSGVRQTLTAPTMAAVNDVLETGARLVAAGGGARLDLCGPPNAAVSIYRNTSLTPGTATDPGGATSVLDLVLDAQGRATVAPSAVAALTATTLQVRIEDPTTSITTTGHVLDPATPLALPELCSCQPCPADLDDNGEVGFTDLIAVLNAWGPCPGCPEDLTSDSTVSFTDLIELLANWGACD